MNPILAHVSGGLALYTGTLLIVIGIIIEQIKGKEFPFSLVGRGFVILGASGMIATSLPQPWLVIGVWATSFLVWRFGVNSEHVNEKYRPLLTIVFLLSTLVILSMEIPYTLDPSAMEKRPDTITVVGDSLTAGIFRLPDKQRWPGQFQNQFGIEVKTIARPGWTVDEARATVNGSTIPPETDLFLLLIGGNDVLRGTPPDDFQQSLNGLLKQLRGENRPIYMMEIPLPPSGYEYGRIQRRLADRYDVRLIPKYHLSQLLSGSNHTLDGIHLSRKGHLALTRRLHSVIIPPPS